MSWTVIVPVKRLAEAKSRLRDQIGLGAEPSRAHEELVLAMMLDTVAAALSSPVVGRVVVISADPEPGEEAALLGAETLPDVPDAGLNPALAYAAAHVRRTGIPGTEPGVAALTADLPALREGELTEALRHAEQAAGSLGPRMLARSFVADAAGTGTVLLAAPPGAALEPCFGPDSAAAHEASGAIRLSGAWPSLRRDVDTAADLAEALVLGVGPRTAAAYAARAAHPAVDG
ncbi:MAG: 2-phospho-L-lactate guanylyltransferase [Micromonosporaceae bacterium]|nr:2-phospho-L-lactate guanylyltransferase [Micromonosporaceae bacterium]